jgi:prevent-host-death family protein
MAKRNIVGAFEAKTKFSELLERVGDGAEIVITKHERPVARLVPYDRPTATSLDVLFGRFSEFAKRFQKAAGDNQLLSYRELIEEGRKR